MALKDYFFFTKEERRGVIVLLLIIFALIGIRVSIAAIGQTTNGGASQYRKYIKKELAQIEINSADTIQLQELKGIGPGFAKRIVKYREQLGGFYAKEQLMEVYGLTEQIYNSIKNSIVVDASKIKRIKINEMDISRLKRHPYISYYEAKAIYDYRMLQPEKKIKNIEELSALPDLKDNWEIIKKYISAE